jgi:hypothetical protein
MSATNGLDGLDGERVAVYLARARVGIGLALLIAPGAATRLWAGGGHDGRGARLFARTTGVREIALGAGGSIAIGQGQGGGDWVSMLAVSDAGDALISLLTPGLPVRARLIGAFAAASAVVHLKLARDLAAAESE